MQWGHYLQLESALSWSDAWSQDKIILDWTTNVWENLSDYFPEFLLWPIDLVTRNWMERCWLSAEAQIESLLHWGTKTRENLIWKDQLQSTIKHIYNLVQVFSALFCSILPSKQLHRLWICFSLTCLLQIWSYVCRWKCSSGVTWRCWVNLAVVLRLLIHSLCIDSV